MDIQELKASISEKFGEEEFCELLMDEQETDEEFDTKVGLNFKFLKCDKDYQGDDCWDYVYRFKIADKLYQVNGFYSSYDGGGIDDVMSFYEVKPVKKEITVYEPI